MTIFLSWTLFYLATPRQKHPIILFYFKEFFYHIFMPQVLFVCDMTKLSIFIVFDIWQTIEWKFSWKNFPAEILYEHYEILFHKISAWSNTVLVPHQVWRRKSLFRRPLSPIQRWRQCKWIEKDTLSHSTPEAADSGSWFLLLMPGSRWERLVGFNKSSRYLTS